MSAFRCAVIAFMTPVPPWEWPVIPTPTEVDLPVKHVFPVLGAVFVQHAQKAHAHLGAEAVPGVLLLGGGGDEAPGRHVLLERGVFRALYAGAVYEYDDRQRPAAGYVRGIVYLVLLKRVQARALEIADLPRAHREVLRLYIAPGLDLLRVILRHGRALRDIYEQCGGRRDYEQHGRKDDNQHFFQSFLRFLRPAVRSGGTLWA